MEWLTILIRLWRGRRARQKVGLVVGLGLGNRVGWVVGRLMDEHGQGCLRP